MSRAEPAVTSSNLHGPAGDILRQHWRYAGRPLILRTDPFRDLGVSRGVDVTAVAPASLPLTVDARVAPARTQSATIPATDAVLRTMRRVVVVIAHADDEVFATSLLRRLADLGAEVSIICLTDGANNPKTDKRACGLDEVVVCRQRELEKSAALLGVHNVISAKFADGALAEQRDGATALVAETLRSLDADTVVTFEPSGISHHGDHIAALDVAAAAMRTLQTTPRLLMITPPWLSRLFLGTDLESGEHPDRLHVPIDASLRELKTRVIDEAYPSQRRTLRAGTLFLPPWLFFRIVRNEQYYWYESAEAARYVRNRGGSVESPSKAPVTSSTSSVHTRLDVGLATPSPYGPSL